MSDAPAADTSAVSVSAPAPPPAVEPAARRQRRFRPRSAVGMVLQVVLIALGVFLGLAGEQWREERQSRRLADDALGRLKTELVANREEVARVKDYHAERLAELKKFFATPVEARDATIVRFAGVRTPFFERSAYDLALTTGSLANIDPELAFHLSRTYHYQDVANELGRGVMNAMYTRPPADGDATFFAVLELYYGDLGGLEPGLLEAYDALIPAIDSALAN
jgi:hypothetical protein